MKTITRSNIYLPMAAIILTVAIAVPAAAEQQVPFKGTFQGSDTVTPPTTIATAATGTGTHLGQFSFTHVLTLTTLIGSAHWVAANGDSIDSTSVVSAVPGPVVFTITEIHTITGGTGRFSGAGGVTHGFLLHEGSFTTIDVPGASSTQPLSINPQGDIVGQYAAGGITHGFLLHKEGSFTTIDVPGASSTGAFGINPQGDIVGQYAAGGITHGFLLDKVGSFTAIDVPGASVTMAFAINFEGDIVGQYSAGGVTHGFLRDKEGSFTTIDVPGASSTSAVGINPRGDIVGNYSAGGINHGFLAQR